MATVLRGFTDVFAAERLRIARGRIWEVTRELLRRPTSAAGLATIVAFVVMAVLAPVIAGPFPQYSPPVNLGLPNAPPGPGFPLGTDFTGRSNFALLMYASRVSLVVGVVASFVAMTLGTMVGVVAGYYGQARDRILSWVTNFFLVIPWLPFVIVVVSILGRGFWSTVIAISVVSWPTTARVVRSKVLSLKNLGYVQRARAVGAGDWHIMYRHILPVLGPLIFANTILTVSTSIWTESFLAFFGLSDVTMPSWGTMIESSWLNLDFLRGAYWSFLPPGICITALVLAFAMVNHVMEEILNPKLRKR